MTTATAPQSETTTTAAERTGAQRPPRDWREGRRLRAWELHDQGWTGTRIAEALGVTQGAVSQWLKRAREGDGREALRHQCPPGATPKLTTEQREQIPTLLEKGAEAYGFVGEVWTTARVAAVIARELKVHYHPAHVSRILRALEWTPQKPKLRATQQDARAITTWRHERWPELERKTRTKTERSFSSTSPASTSSHS